jgi:hypothetical protein
MTITESNELQAIMALDDAGIKAEINRKGQVVIKKKDKKKAHIALEKSFKKGGWPPLKLEDVELDEEIFNWYLIKGNLEKGKVAFVGTEKQVKLKRHDRKFSGNYVMTKSRKDLKMGDKWKKSMGVSEEVEIEEKALSGKEVAKRMLNYKGKGGHNYLKGFAKDVAKMKTVSRDDLEKLFPDYVSGGDITKLLEEVQKPRTAYEVVSEARSRIIETIDRAAADEIYNFMQNERDLERQKDSIIKNIVRKKKSGKYDHSKAPKLWMFWVDNGAKAYDKLNSSPGVKTFDKDTRWSVAIQFANEYNAEIDLGNYS